MGHYLFTQWDGGGSLPPELTVIRRLVAAGHTVAVLGDPVTEPEVRAVGVTDFRPWVDAPHHVTRDVADDYTRDWQVRSPLGVLRNLMETLMVRPAPLFAAETLAAIDDVRPDAVAASFTLLGSLMAAEARGIPCAALVPNVVSLPAEGMPPFGTGFLPPRGPLGRLRDRALNGLIDRLWNQGLPELNRARTSLGLPPLARLLEQYERPERVLALTRIPVRGLVTTGPAVDPEQIRAPDGVTVVRSAPHREVLAHAAVLVTHGGHGTVVKGLVAGVPIACMPTGRDQPDNAARLTQRGAGVRISKDASPAKVAAAVRLLLDDPSYRRCATRLGAHLRADAESDAALTEMEALAVRTGHGVS